MTLNPEHFISGYNKLLSFRSGALYVHEAKESGGDPVYSEFYGNTVTHTMKVTANANFNKVKVFEALSLYTDNRYFYEAYRDANGGYTAGDLTELDTNCWKALTITVPSSAHTRENGMSSRLKHYKFKMVEGVLHAAFESDLNSPYDPLTGYPSWVDTDAKKESYRLLNGRKLKGHIIEITLTNTNPEQVKLFSVIVKSTDSERSKS